MKKKVSLFIDKQDLEILCTNDNIINITGMIGSGKTTLANKYRNNKDYTVISLDCLYRGQDKENMNEETKKINELLSKKFPNQNNEKDFKKYYREIIKYIHHSSSNKIYILEGQHIYRYLNIEDITGRLIIKRTGIIKCWRRSIIRHIKRKKVDFKNKKITKKQYYHNVWYWIKRRTYQLKYYKDFNNFLNRIKKI